MYVFENPCIEPTYAPELADPANAERLLVQAGLHVDNMDFMWSEIGYGQSKLRTGEHDPDIITPEQYRNNCLQRIYRMEQERPGLAKQLNKNRGLYNFGRIPLRSLLLQNLPHRRYNRRIWAGFTSADWNGATLDSGLCLDVGHDRMPNSDDVDLAIDEFHTVERLGEQLERRKYEWRHDSNGPNKADVIMLAGHGTPSRLLIYKNEGTRGSTREALKKSDLEAGVGRAILGISHPNTVVLVDACSAAKGDDSLCEAIHEATGLHTIGAITDIGTRFLRFRSHGNKTNVVPGFFKLTPQGKGYVHHRSPARHFRPSSVRPISLPNANRGSESDLASAA